MSLFGKAAVTKTTVKPAWQTEQILRDVVNRSGNINQDFIGHEMAGMSADQRGALAQLAASPELQRASGLLSGQTTQGLQNYTNANQAYNSVLNNPVTAQQINDFRSSMTGPASLSSRSIGQGTHTGSNLGGSAALRSAGRFNTSNINAKMQNQRSQQMGGLGISNALGNNKYTQSVAGLESGLGGANIRLGEQGINLGQQAIQNQLQAGNLQQQFQQAQYNNDWQNQMGQSMNAWNQLNNRLNVLNQVSPMAGYTQTGTTAAASKGAQLYGAGLSALGTYGKLGGFQSFGAQDNNGNYKNQIWNNGGTGAFNGVGDTLSGWGNSALNWFGGSS